MVKFWRKYENKIVLSMGFILVAAIAFAGGILYEEQTNRAKKEPLVLSEREPSSKTLSVIVEKIDGQTVYARTQPWATVKIGEHTVLETDHQGNFQFALAESGLLSVYDQNNVLTIDLSALDFPQQEIKELQSREESQAEETAAPPLIPTTPSKPPEVQVERGEQTEEKQEEKLQSQFVGSKNSDKYHLPDCRWAKRIKPENQVWFSSEEEARAKGYQPCSQCHK